MADASIFSQMVFTAPAARSFAIHSFKIVHTKVIEFRVLRKPPEVQPDRQNRI